MSEDQIKAIVAQVLDIEIDAIPDQLVSFKHIPHAQTDEIAQIRYYLCNQHLLNDQTIAKLVADQTHTYQTTCMPSFSYQDLTPANATFAQRWADYNAKLESILQQVIYRRSQSYQYNNILPPLQQILQLQQQCWILTCEHYGAGKGNLSCFFQYFIRMCEAGNITRFAYADITKYLSADKYTAHIDLQQRKQFIFEHDKHLLSQHYSFGGIQARGRTEIDATSINNTLYYKNAQQYLYLETAKKCIVGLLSDGKYGVPLENYGQLPSMQKQLLWQLIQQHYPANTQQDKDSIFYQFAQFCNLNPGSCFTDLPAELSEAMHVPPHWLHAIVKFAGLSCGALILLDRCAIEDWTPKRYMIASWQRKYPLLHLRNAGKHEHMRIVPNEMPYVLAHGLSLCGDGLLDGLAEHQSWQYSWNSPIDVREEVDNTARDVEKVFRELKLIAPHPAQDLLPGETLLNIFQNTVAYSTQSSQHTHITHGTIETYPIYMLPAISSKFVDSLNATVSLVQVGLDPDAMFLKVQFRSLDNEAVIEFLIKLYHDLYAYFAGAAHVDSFIQLFPTNTGEYVFIFEPHASLIKLPSGEFMNKDTQETTIRKPFWFIPQGKNVYPFPADSELSAGLESLRKFYDKTRKLGVKAYIEQYTSHLI